MPIIVIGDAVFTSEKEADKFKETLKSAEAQKEYVPPTETAQSRCQKCGCGITLGLKCPACGEL